MKIITPGNEEKIQKIKEEREQTENPVIKCEGCDAEFQVTAGDIEARPPSGSYYFCRWSFSVKCPCCWSKIYIARDKLPSNYEAPADYNWGVTYIPSPSGGQPINIEPTWYGDPVPNPNITICGKPAGSNSSSSSFATDCKTILEDTIDMLIEVGNGITDKDLHCQADALVSFRDLYFKPGLTYD